MAIPESLLARWDNIAKLITKGSDGTNPERAMILATFAGAESTERLNLSLSKRLDSLILQLDRLNTNLEFHRIRNEEKQANGS